MPLLFDRLAMLANENERFQNGSMNITVKNLPEPIYRVIKREAKKNRRSLNAEIIRVLEMEAAEAERLRQFGDLRKELERFAATLPPLDDSAPLIRRDRER
jgi:hypothetical protein